MNVASMRKAGARLRGSLSAADLGDLERGVRLTMSGLPPVVLPATELEDDDFLGAVLGHDLGLHARIGEERRSDLEGCPALGRDQQDLLEGDRVTDVAGELLHPQLVAQGYAILLSARLDDR